MCSLLQLMGKRSDQQIATETERRSGAMQLAPGKPQIVRRLGDQSGNLAFGLCDVQVSRLVVSVAAAAGNRRRPARALASRSVVECRFHTLAGSAMR
jgi:hypothetical protein